MKREKRSLNSICHSSAAKRLRSTNSRVLLQSLILGTGCPVACSARVAQSILTRTDGVEFRDESFRASLPNDFDQPP